MTNKPIRWVSPTNAWAIGAQLISLVIPILVVTEVYQPTGLDELNATLSQIWQWVLLAGSSIAVTSTFVVLFAVGDGHKMRAVIRVELAATITVSACYMLLWYSLAVKYGIGSNPLTETLVGGMGLSALARVIQILYELGRYRRAVAAGRIAHVEALAQSKED